MRCEQFEQRLHRLLDRRETPSEDSRLNRHAERCAQCRETLAACGHMLDGLNLMELPVPGDDFPLRVIRQTQVARPALAASRRFNAAWAALAVTLALALLLPVAWRKDRAESAAASGPLFARTMQPATPRAVEDGTAPIRPKRPQGPALASSLDLDQQQPLVLLRSWTASWSDRWNPVDGLADGLTPIMTPLSVAVEEIRRTIPLGLADRPAAPSADSVRNRMNPDKPPVA
ncbi:MAG: zf-HC2 domain-containing protein [Pirellulaceae bacterium]|jgi:anti-sigma factor RsiW|nr:zf-HC2 domain-containing protein [Pirellulaceae bacterium]